MITILEVSLCRCCSITPQDFKKTYDDKQCQENIHIIISSQFSLATQTAIGDGSACVIRTTRSRARVPVSRAAFWLDCSVGIQFSRPRWGRGPVHCPCSCRRYCLDRSVVDSGVATIACLEDWRSDWRRREDRPRRLPRHLLHCRSH